MVSKDELLKKVGKFGWFQKRLVGTVIISSLLSSSMLVICNVFVVYTPPHRCFIPEIDENTTLTHLHQNLPAIEGNGAANGSLNENYDLLSRYIPIETELDGAERWSRCYRYVDTVTDSFSNRTQMKCDQGWRYLVDRGVVSAAMQFDLVCDRAWLAPLAPTMQLCGFIVGNIGGGYISDRYGRRFSLLLSWTFFITSTTVISLMPVWEVTYVFWLIMGMGGTSRASTTSVVRLVSIGLFVLGPQCVPLISSHQCGWFPTNVRVNEWTPTKYRYLAGCINLAMCGVCYMIIPLLNYVVVNYRHFLALYASLQFLMMVLIFRNVKESLSWLLQHSKNEEALKMLKEIAKVNNKMLEKDDEEYLIDNIELTKCAKEENQTMTKKRMSYVDMVKIPFIRKRLFILSLAWTATVLNYHGLSLNTNSLGGNRYIACFLSAVMEIPGHVLSFFGLKKIGGRTSYMIMIALCGSCLLLSLPFIHVNQTAVVICNMTGKLFASGTVAIVYVFAGDFFPTLLRNQSYGASNVPARIVAMCAPFLLYLGEHVSEAIPYLVMGFFSMIAAIAVFFLPEIKGTPLPETLEDAKDQEKLIKTCKCKQPKTKDENANHDSRVELS